MSRRVPCGMNSILYLGGSMREAGRVFDDAQTGLDTWNKPNPSYGVVLSIWNGSDYIIKREKGPT